jgi:hypothetical protein
MTWLARVLCYLELRDCERCRAYHHVLAAARARLTRE